MLWNPLKHFNTNAKLNWAFVNQTFNASIDIFGWRKHCHVGRKYNKLKNPNASEMSTYVGETKYNRIVYTKRCCTLYNQSSFLVSYTICCLVSSRKKPHKCSLCSVHTAHTLSINHHHLVWSGRWKVEYCIWLSECIDFDISAMPIKW